MNIDYLIQLLTNRLSGLALAKDQTFSAGDLERINTIDTEILDVQITLSKLRLVSNVEQAATVSSLTVSQIVQRGIESIYTPSVINDSTEVLLKYNIEPYATDPYHETKIQTILENMGIMDSPDLINAYLKKSTPDSPVTGLMVYNSAAKYNVDARLMMAIMELDSRYGTQGLGARTFNPGNVGNNGFEERSYGSWEAGVDAVANWLHNHRIVQDVFVNSPTVEPMAFTTVLASTPITTIESIAISPDTATAITSTSTSIVVVNTASSTEPVINIPIDTATTTDPVVTETPATTTATTTDPIVTETSTTTTDTTSTATSTTGIN